MLTEETKKIQKNRELGETLPRIFQAKAATQRIPSPSELQIEAPLFGKKGSNLKLIFKFILIAYSYYYCCL